MTHYCPICGQGYDSEAPASCEDDGATLKRIGRGDDRRLGLLIQDRFRLVEVLGSGGAGVVYRAIQRPIGRHVAVKILSDTDRSKHSSEFERFFREAKLASSLRHPNIVSPVDFGEDQEHRLVYFAMEYVEGVDLHELLDGRRITVPLALEILYQACGALTDAHDKGIIHRDLKPGNIRLTVVSDGSLQAKVLDLGIARPIKTNKDITETGNITGTMSYIPPEYVLEGTLGGHSDLYSLGIVFFELLTGQKPFSGNHLQILFHHVSTPPPAIDNCLPDGQSLPEAMADDVEALFRQLVEKKPERRFKSAREVRKQIEALRSTYDIDSIHFGSDASPATVKTFEPWLAEANATIEDIESLPPDAIDNLMEVGAEMITEDPDQGGARLHLPTPPPLPADSGGFSPTPDETDAADLPDVPEAAKAADAPDEDDEGDVEELDIDDLEVADEDSLDDDDLASADDAHLDDADLGSGEEGIDLGTDGDLENLEDASNDVIYVSQAAESRRKRRQMIAGFSLGALLLVGLIGWATLGGLSDPESSDDAAQLSTADDPVAPSSESEASDQLSEAGESPRDERESTADSPPTELLFGASDADNDDSDSDDDESEADENLAQAFREAVEDSATGDDESQTDDDDSSHAPEPSPAAPQPDDDDDPPVDNFQNLLDRAGTL